MSHRPQHLPKTCFGRDSPRFQRVMEASGRVHPAVPSDGATTKFSIDAQVLLGETSALDRFRLRARVEDRVELSLVPTCETARGGFRLQSKQA